MTVPENPCAQEQLLAPARLWESPWHSECEMCLAGFLPGIVPSVVLYIPGYKEIPGVRINYLKGIFSTSALVCLGEIPQH